MIFEAHDDSGDILATAFDLAINRFHELEGADADDIDTRARLTARLVVLSKNGELDAETLASQAVLYLRTFAVAMRLSRQSGQPTVPSSPQQFALGPDAIQALDQALQQCLDELPQGGVTSSVRSILQRSLLETAGEGERSVEALRSVALNAVRNRG